MEDQELYDEIIWVMTHYGSDARERAEPGSKLQSQAARIVQFVTEREEARSRIRGLHTVRVVRAFS